MTIALKSYNATLFKRLVAEYVACDLVPTFNSKADEIKFYSKSASVRINSLIKAFKLKKRNTTQLFTADGEAIHTYALAASSLQELEKALAREFLQALTAHSINIESIVFRSPPKIRRVKQGFIGTFHVGFEACSI